MPSPIPDTRLAARFTQTSHSHHSPSIEPSTNKLPTPLNVCIIGSSQGIGAGIVDAYAKALAPSSSLILAARQSSASSLAAVEHHTKAINPKIKVLSLFVDITKNESVKELAKTIKKKVGKLDIVVLNSGYSGPVVLKVTEGDPQDFQDVFDVNVQGTYLIAHHLIPILIESGGAKQFLVVNTLGSLITSGPIANTAYCVSKMAQMRIIEFVGEQYGKEEDGGVNSVLVHPGAVLTEMADNTTPDSFRSCEFSAFFE
jgi:NAD(P)-dependent dehydrogenase (short-subunit alcohol dehydrogenase family)